MLFESYPPLLEEDPPELLPELPDDDLDEPELLVVDDLLEELLGVLILVFDLLELLDGVFILVFDRVVFDLVLEEFDLVLELLNLVFDLELDLMLLVGLYLVPL